MSLRAGCRCLKSSFTVGWKNSYVFLTSTMLLQQIQPWNVHTSLQLLNILNFKDCNFGSVSCAHFLRMAGGGCPWMEASVIKQPTQAEWVRRICPLCMWPPPEHTDPVGMSGEQHMCVQPWGHWWATGMTKPCLISSRTSLYPAYSHTLGSPRTS